MTTAFKSGLLEVALKHWNCKLIHGYLTTLYNNNMVPKTDYYNNYEISKADFLFQLLFFNKEYFLKNMENLNETVREDLQKMFVGFVPKPEEPYEFGRLRSTTYFNSIKNHVLLQYLIIHYSKKMNP